MNVSIAGAEPVPNTIRVNLDLGKLKGVALDVRPRSDCRTCNGAGRVFKAGNRIACDCVKRAVGRWRREREETVPIRTDAPAASGTPPSIGGAVRPLLAAAEAEVAALVAARDAAVGPLDAGIVVADAAMTEMRAGIEERLLEMKAVRDDIEADLALVEAQLKTLADRRAILQERLAAHRKRIEVAVGQSIHDTLAAGDALAVAREERDRVADWHAKRLRGPQKRLSRLQAKVARTERETM